MKLKIAAGRREEIERTEQKVEQVKQNIIR